MNMLRHFLIMRVVFCLDIEILSENGKKPAEILKQFVDYQIIVHYDNVTLGEIDQFFIGDSVDSMAFLLYNYDRGDYELRRPLGYKFLNLVLLSNPFDFEKFLSVNLNLCYLDVVLFFVKDLVLNPSLELNYQLKSFWTLTGLDSSGSLIVYDMVTEDFYYVRFYFGAESGVLNKISVEEKGAMPDLPGYMNEFEDFNGHVFYVAYYPYAPFIWCESEIVDGPGCNVKGIEGNILLLLSKYLNFAFVMKHADSQTSGSIWKDMIEDVHFGRRNWAVGGMSTSSERMQLVEFTTMLHMESYTTFYVSSDIEIGTWDGALRPFTFTTWIQLFIDIVCIGIIIKLMAVVYNISKYLHLVDSMSIPFCIILEQSVIPNLRIRVFNLKLILSVWFLMSIIITTAYKSKLASTMIKPVKREPGSILDLYDEGYMFQVNNEDWSVLHEHLAVSTDQRYVNILDRCNNDLTFCDAVVETLDRRVAIIDEDTGMQYIILTSCRNYTPYQLSRFRRARDYLFPSLHAWPMKYGAPYKYRFSITLQRLVDAGIIEYWYKKLITKPIPISNIYNADSTKTGVLKISSFYGTLSILLIGELISIMVFIGEILYFYYSK